MACFIQKLQTVIILILQAGKLRHRDLPNIISQASVKARSRTQGSWVLG